MKCDQKIWTKAGGWTTGSHGLDPGEAQLVLVFGATSLLEDGQLMDEARRLWPGVLFAGCSTAGEIFDTRVTDDSLVATAFGFEHTGVKGAWVCLAQESDSFEAGKRLAAALPQSASDGTESGKTDLAHVFVLSDGLNVNGSELVRGLTGALPAGVTVTGGLAADGARFERTLVFLNSAPEGRAVAAIGFYGSRLKVGFASLGGWDPFGPERLITRSTGNILYELDGQSALKLYKSYLGKHANELPASGLLYPLSLRPAPDGAAVVRTILAVDEKDQSLTFAGDVPQGRYARLMKANFDRLVDGASGAARSCLQATGSPDLAILISCVGRKLVLRQRIEEEVEGVREILGENTLLAGFYSYGEISPFASGAKCELHNQTMTITTFSEK
jgi:hypothetical protein